MQTLFQLHKALSFSLEGVIVLLKSQTRYVNKPLDLHENLFPRTTSHFLSLTISLLGPYTHQTMIFKELRMEGFMLSRWKHKDPESLKRLMGWLKEVSD